MLQFFNSIVEPASFPSGISQSNIIIATINNCTGIYYFAGTPIISLASGFHGLWAADAKVQAPDGFQSAIPK
jgi:hypothetical protein